MSAHSEASDDSQNLCQILFKGLSKLIPGLQRKQTKQWCALFEQELVTHYSIDVIPRDEIRSGWEERFPARFVIDDDSDIPAACDLLFTVSYRAS